VRGAGVGYGETINVPRIDIISNEISFIGIQSAGL
jgi:hypothetical protein